MKIPNKKKNDRRRFFNNGKGPQCKKCGSLLVKVVNLAGQTAADRCPLCL